jgi:hypothetical protein
MKRLLIFGIIVFLLIFSNLFSGEFKNVNAASCSGASCVTRGGLSTSFIIGDVLVGMQKPGWYKSYGLCIFDIGYINNNGALIFTTVRYSDNYMVGPVYVRIASNAYDKSGIAMIRFYPKVFYRYYNGRIVRYYNNCWKFQWVAP